MDLLESFVEKVRQYVLRRWSIYQFHKFIRKVRRSFLQGKFPGIPANREYYRLQKCFSDARDEAGNTYHTVILKGAFAAHPDEMEFYRREGAVDRLGTFMIVSLLTDLLPEQDQAWIVPTRVFRDHAIAAFKARSNEPKVSC